MKKKYKYLMIGIFVVLIIGVIVLLFTKNNSNNNVNITVGDNHYSLNKTSVSDDGLNSIEELVDKSEYMTDNKTISSLKISLNKDTSVKSFELVMNVFDDNKNYIGTGTYNYSNGSVNYSYQEDNHQLIVNYSDNDTLDYLSTNIKKIPLKEEMDVLNMSNNSLYFEPNVQVDKLLPAFDGRNNQSFKVLSADEYNKFEGGSVDVGMHYIIKLNDGTSNFVGNQFMYVFDYYDKDQAKNPNFMMDTDYYINNGTLKFTRDYGSTWITTDISSKDVEETLDFYGDISLTPNSWFMSTDLYSPIAYFYGEEPVLKYSSDQGKTWNSHTFVLSKDIDGKPITNRVVGFTDSKFGYVALGTEWTMGSGEAKYIYFTYDGGRTWKSINTPKNNSSHSLIDLVMYNEKVGVIALKDSNDSSYLYLLSTTDGGNTWNEVNYIKVSLPDEVTGLRGVDSIAKENDEYYITLDKRETDTLRVTFKTSDMINWNYLSDTRKNIHTVG